MKNKILGFIPLLSALVLSSISYQPSEQEIIDPVGPAPMGEFSNDFKGELIAKNVAPASDEIVVPKTVKVHYQVEDGNYDNLIFWMWGTNYEPGIEFAPTGIDDYGMYIDIDMTPFGETEFLGFLVMTSKDWTSKTQDAILEFDTWHPDAEGLLEVWAYPELNGTVSVFKTREETMGGKIVSANFTDWQNVHVVCSEQPYSYKIYALSSYYFNLIPSARQVEKAKFCIKDYKFAKNSGLEFDIKFPNIVPASMVFNIEVTFPDNFAGTDENGEPLAFKTKAKDIETRGLYRTKRFNQFYTYEGNDLGITYTKEKTTFKLWAPTSASARIKIFDGGTPNVYKNFDLYKMSYTSGGVWSCEIEGDLNGKYYTYVVNNATGENEVCDPYAHAAGLNGIRGMILDFDTTDPEGWENVPEVWDGVEGYDLKQPNDLSVYEVHIRDLTMHETWTGKKKAGTYNAFIEKGTTYGKNGVSVKTGFDHIEELGVNAVQILPFFDQLNDEEDHDHSNSKIDTPYNWGYNPLNYNVPEGAYSMDPYKGEVRVKEIKQMVQAFANNKNHARVIMDVVYNHVGSVTTSNFDKLVPGYFFRLTNEGKFYNYSGCGNDVRTEAKMMRKFIVDSVTWWASEYKIKGFRFDLMGLIDVNTMKAVKDAVYAIDPDNVCYGEGWPYADHPSNPANTDNVYSKLYPSPDSPGICGGFSDSFRDGMRGGNGWGFDKYPDHGWINPDKGAVGDRAEAIALGMRGQYKGKGGNPYQTVNYASCHDNFTLFDQLYWTLSPDGGKTEPDLNIIMETMIAVQSAVAFSNGIAFFHSGEELLRSKVDEDAPDVEGADHSFSRMYGKKISHNSYISKDATNAFNYANKISVTYKGEEVDTTDFFAKYCKLIQARKDFVSRFPYSSTENYSSHWFDINDGRNDKNANGATGIGVWYKYNGGEYWLLFSGYKASTIGFGESANSELIYNSLGEGKYTVNSDNTLTLSARQLLVFKRK